MRFCASYALKLRLSGTCFRAQTGFTFALEFGRSSLRWRLSRAQFGRAGLLVGRLLVGQLLIVWRPVRGRPSARGAVLIPCWVVVAGALAEMDVMSIQAERVALVRYVYIDIVHFSVGRTIEAQTWIIHALNRIVRLAIASMQVDPGKVLCLPTGDGVCVCLIDLADPFDLDIRIALSVLEQLYGLSLVQTSAERRFAVRIGLNENQDNLVTDIGGGLNVVGLGINSAHRIMSLAGPFQLFMGVSVHARLTQRALYRDHLHAVDAIVKHGERMLSYAYHDPALACFAAAAAPRRRDDGANLPKPTAPLVQLPLSSLQRRRSRSAPSFRIG